MTSRPHPSLPATPAADRAEASSTPQVAAAARDAADDDAPPGSPVPRPTIRLRDPSGVVAAVPYLLGFTPRRSLVVLGVEDTGSVGPTLRWDWAPDDPESATAAGWWHAVQVMRRNGCSRVLVVACTDRDPLDVAPAARAGLLDVVLADAPPAGSSAALAPAGHPLDASAPVVLDVLLVGPARFTSLVCADDSCCPAVGLPVRGTDAHPVAAAFVVSGRSPAVDRESLEPPDTTATVADRRTAAEAAAGARARWRDGQDDAAVDLLQSWRSSLPQGPGPELAGRLVVAWTRLPRLRDACLSVFLPDASGVADALIGPLDAAAPDLAAVLSDPACALAADRGGPVLRRLAGLADGRERATVLAAHAWLAWVAGQGSAAGVLAERALVDDPEQSLAGLVMRCLQHGLGAPWTSAGQPPVRRPPE